MIQEAHYPDGSAVKLLFDENLASRLVHDLADHYPNSAHVLSLDLGGAPDEELWERAGADGFVFVTKDEDFHRMSVMLGPPSKVVWIRLGNCATAEIAQLLRSHADAIEAFVPHPETSFLEVG